MLDEGHIAYVINLDFFRTLDYVNHKHLLAKMKSFGLGDVVGSQEYRWVENSGGDPNAQWCSFLFPPPPWQEKLQWLCLHSLQWG